MDLTTSQLYLLAGVALLGLWATSARKSRSNSNRLPLPPGPMGYPVVGNLFEIPREKVWLLYDQWHQLYGDMVYYEMLGQPILILGSLKRTNDLFEKRSSNYSSRIQKLPMLLDL
ncbi:hypothetical protein K443DRAFT_106465 [Laccaria amethystina LaAM-08-1]|uniref:Cytochrome P450 n=1 Tax=Laccaria amethystina LaAM-08-1 TaxID=1095629 RepID=A0A0C9X6I4_9AGAR|nr:hypothetical protein K443DRAFT_106465 [Laccaria amethystina LaAM-08-1]